MNLSEYIHHTTTENITQGVCVTGVTQAWNAFINNFQVLNLFAEPTKNLCDWELITIACDADTFHDCSTLFSISWIEHWSTFSVWCEEQTLLKNELLNSRLHKSLKELLENRCLCKFTHNLAISFKITKQKISFLVKLNLQICSKISVLTGNSLRKYELGAIQLKFYLSTKNLQCRNNFQTFFPLCSISHEN